MDSSPPPLVRLSNVFSEDYEYFQSNHAQFPDSASTVFGCVADLRAALQAFRGAVQSAKQCKPDSLAEQDNVVNSHQSEEVIHSEMAEPVLSASVEGSVE